MRRFDREIRDRKEIEEILRTAMVGHLGLSSNDQPYVVPLNFAHKGGSIYFHCADSGMKMQFIRNNPRVCFEVYECFGTKSGQTPCEYSTRYRSVVAFGRAEIIAARDEKAAALRLILAKYAGDEMARRLTPSMVQRHRSSRGSETVAVRIRVQEVTGKRSDQKIRRGLLANERSK